MLGGSLFSTVLGTMLPGAGTVYLAQDLHFRRPVKPGDTLTARVVVREMHADTNRVVLDCVCTNQNGREVISGTAEVIAPTEKVRRGRMAMPQVSLVRHAAYDQLLARAGGVAPLPTAVVHPCDKDSLQRRDGGGSGGVHRADPGRPGNKNPGRRGRGRNSISRVSRSSMPNIRMPPPRSPSGWLATARSRR